MEKEDANRTDVKYIWTTVDDRPEMNITTTSSEHLKEDETT